MTLPNQVNPLLQAPVPAYSVYNSLRFRSSATAYLSRTPASAGSRTTWTWSGWVKRGKTGNYQRLVFATSGAILSLFRFNTSDQLEYLDYNTGTTTVVNIIVTAGIFRDPSSWYHLIFTYDTTNATSANRIRIYVNGVLAPLATSTMPSLSYVGSINSTSTNYISDTSTEVFDGYMAEVNFIDGQALTPSSFGAYSANGVWQPTRYTGSYGTNGFYLKFASFGTAAALGTDSSGNGNTWTVNNISVTAGTTYDPMLDSPTLTSATVANYCTMNPVGSKFSAGDVLAIFSNGNLQTNGAAGTSNVNGTLGSLTGKFYYECYCNVSGGSGNIIVGLNTVTSGYNMTVGIRNNATNTGLTITSGAAFTFTTGDTVGVAFDLSGFSCIFYKNGVQQLTATYGVPGAATAWAQMNGATDSLIWNFGQRPFSYTPPSGYVALNAYNLPTPTIANGATVMAATTYTGNGSTQSILNSNNTTTAVSFYPGLVWLKTRNSAVSHYLFDTNRGVGVQLQSDTNGAENTFGNTLTSFNSNGFSLGSSAGVNFNTNTYIGWQWQAGQGSSSSNTNGSITSTVSVNATAGFSVVTYTGNGVSGATFGHGLGVAPQMIIFKNRGTINDWQVYHISLGSNYYLKLNSTAAQIAAVSPFDQVTPGSSTVTIGSGQNINYTGYGIVAYCWSAVAGYSAFGSYTGNGSTDGPFVYTGFRPRFVMIKSSSNTSTEWLVWDSSRNTYNSTNSILYPNQSFVEFTGSAADMDFLSNGFKWRNANAGTASSNQSGYTYIYAAFAENPFKYALAR